MKVTVMAISMVMFGGLGVQGSQLVLAGAAPIFDSFPDWFLILGGLAIVLFGAGIMIPSDRD